MSKKSNLLVAASGTGGHIFPALSLIDDLYDDWNISWLGVKNRCENNLVPRQYNLLTLNIDSPRGKNIFLIKNYIKVLLATFKVLKIINRKEIKLVFTTGGYISAPSILAAKISNIPVIIHESNLIPGLVTKIFGRYCDFVLTGFEDTKFHLKGCKTVFTGTPLRNQFYIVNQMPRWLPDGDGPLIIIMGGSQGAKVINDIIYNLLDFFIKNNFRLVHIVGNSLDSKFKDKQNKNYVPITFTNEIAALMQNCDLVISRSGSGSINEIIKTKTPSILIPYPYAKNNHQEKNALILSSIGSSIMIRQNQNLEINLKKSIKRIFKIKSKEKNNRYEILDLMKENLKQLNFKDPRLEIQKIINSYRKDF